MNAKRYFVITDLDPDSRATYGPFTLSHATRVASDMLGWRAVVELVERVSHTRGIFDIVRTWEPALMPSGQR